MMNILDLYLSERQREAAAAKPKVTVIWSDGAITHEVPKAPSDTLGHFEGKVGTITRSRKGRTSRKPNGSRYYLGPDGQPEVVAYRL